MRVIVGIVVFLLAAAGCAATVSGSAESNGEVASTTSGAAPTTTTTTKSRPPISSATIRSSTSAAPSTGPPTTIDPAANQQYCDQTISGALGKPMMVVVVETPEGRITCDGAGAVLYDYYAQRPDPNPGSDPIEVDGFSCNQVPEPDLPQVICSDGASLLYSMWRQGG